jgi:DNA (cytosine-5)-methyltransferase 1
VTDFVATITTKQDRNPNAGNLYFPYSESKFRFLTPREAMIIMGFKESDFEKINRYNFKLTKKYDLYSRDNYYKIIGNSIVVDVLVEIFKQVKDILELLKL